MDIETRCLTLCYHDVLSAGAGPSGFQSPGAQSYKVPLPLFREHLRAIESERGPASLPVRFTFDDGGSSAMCIAEELQRAGYRGCFFVTTSFIGKPGFVRSRDIAELRAAGHTIGSHGLTHSGRMSTMAEPRLLREWSESVQALAAITGAPVTTASVPSGYYAPRVARAAARAGIRELFTLRPTLREGEESGCRITGRFTVRAWTPASRVAALARGSGWPRMADAFSWQVRQLAKAVGGSAYTEVRRLVLEHRVPPASPRP